MTYLQFGAQTVVIISGLGAAYFSVRIAIDHTLLTELEPDDPASLARLDTALSQLGWMKTPGRSLPDRLAATTRLVKILGILVVVQVIALVAGLVQF